MEQNIITYKNAVDTIKTAILQSPKETENSNIA